MSTENNFGNSYKFEGDNKYKQYIIGADSQDIQPKQGEKWFNQTKKKEIIENYISLRQKLNNSDLKNKPSKSVGIFNGNQVINSFKNSIPHLQANYQQIPSINYENTSESTNLKIEMEIPLI